MTGAEQVFRLYPPLDQTAGQPLVRGQLRTGGKSGLQGNRATANGRPA